MVICPADVKLPDSIAYQMNNLDTKRLRLSYHVIELLGLESSASDMLEIILTCHQVLSLT